jgi:hypothetical protein
MGTEELGPSLASTLAKLTEGPGESLEGTMREPARSNAAVAVDTVAALQDRCQVAWAACARVVVSGFWPATSWKAMTRCEEFV